VGVVVVVVVGLADELEVGVRADELEAGVRADELEAGAGEEAADRHCPISHE
jgi:hypothetical protein